MFVLTDSYRYFWPVTVLIPNPDRPGQTIEQSFDIEFEAIPLEEAEV
ncbi:hypothetical protein LQ948_04770 [Jiella sp. MQZ9-1]|uniref:Uncharacterized protein n=1 Tax=Jiella flava TaxID=2816857 RepID=A0A939FUF7_9HYPH|nr:hypothetical protein [Jiella flava]MBO0662153.1 hypothetical protein [Jiella flava]MCD2470518.1 hypothetical protein [Jiella flava]